MKRIAVVAVLLALLLVYPTWARQDAKERESEREERERERRRERGREGKFDLDFGEAREILKTEGGALRVWSEDIEALRNTHVGIAELQLEQNGLLVPQYTDADKIAYVLTGCGRMGAVIPMQGEFRRNFIRKVEPGDVIALPKGVVYWWYNDGEDQHRVLCASDTSHGANPGRVHQFGLAGGQQDRFGAIWHGFSREILATAWGVDEKMVESLLQRQNDAGIVRTQQKIQFPEPREEEEYRRRRDIFQEMFHRRGASHYFEELKYSTSEQHPDLYVKNGGWLKVVNKLKLPALQSVGFSAMKVALENNAVCAPSFVRNAHQLLFITKGDGRIQVASGDGETIYDKDVKEGSVLVIPQYFPSIKIAGNNGLEWINLLTSDRPSPSFLVGRNSVYKGMPPQVVAAAFNVDEETLYEMAKHSSRKDQEVIFPAESEGERRREEQPQGGAGGAAKKGVLDEVEGWLGKVVLEEAVEQFFA